MRRPHFPGASACGLFAVAILAAPICFAQQALTDPVQKFGDPSIDFRIDDVAILAKFADYQAKGFAVDTRKVWLQADLKY